MSVKKIGNIYEVKLAQGKKYFQYIADDELQLGSNVIRGFKKLYSLDSLPDLNVVANDEVEFYAHCLIKVGQKLKVWLHVGNLSELGSLDIYFRDTDDFGRKLNEEAVNVSDKWYIWKLGDKNHTRIGNLRDQFKNAEIGLVFPPQAISFRMEMGKHIVSYPE